MKRFLRVLLLSGLTAILLTATAFADMGPKTLLAVRVENAPDGLYYLDLLAEDPIPSGGCNLSDEELAALDPSLLQALREAIPAGWHACLLDGSGPPVFGHLTGEQEAGQMLHSFSYHGLPDTYRILIAAESGETWVSDAYTRTVLQSSVTVDWETKTVTVPPAWVGYVLQFLATFVPTLLIEGILLALFGYGRQKRNWLRFLAVNFITQGALALAIAWNALRHGVTGWTLLPFVFLEFVIAVGESALYSRLLEGHGRGRAVLYGLAANVCSAALGLYLVEPVWRFIVSIS